MNIPHDAQRPRKPYQAAEADQKIRAIWRAQCQTDGPAPETLANIKAHIRAEAARHAHHPSRTAAFFYMSKWKPILAVAASLLFLLGALHLTRRAQPQPEAWRELAAVESAITQELEALDATVWDALAELDANAAANDFLLQALAQQMRIWEDI